MKKGLVGGLRPWIIQRFTAIYLLFFFVFLLMYFLFFPPESYEAWKNAISGTVSIIATSVFFLALLVHAWVGLRDVSMDYLRPMQLRIAVLGSLAFGLVGMAVWVVLTLFNAGD